MSPEYKNGNLSTKVDTFVVGLFVIETLTGLPVLIPVVCHRDLFDMFQDDLDTVSKVLAHLDK